LNDVCAQTAKKRETLWRRLTIEGDPWMSRRYTIDAGADNVDFTKIHKFVVDFFCQFLKQPWNESRIVVEPGGETRGGQYHYSLTAVDSPLGGFRTPETA
jgi:hypothetical protein